MFALRTFILNNCKSFKRILSVLCYHALQEFNVSDFVLRAVFFFSIFCLSDKLLFLRRTFPNCFSFRLSATFWAINSIFSFSSSPNSRPGRLLAMKVSKLILILFRLMLSPVFLAISTDDQRGQNCRMNTQYQIIISHLPGSPWPPPPPPAPCISRAPWASPRCCQWARPAAWTAASAEGAPELATGTQGPGGKHWRQDNLLNNVYIFWFVNVGLYVCLCLAKLKLPNKN